MVLERPYGFQQWVEKHLPSIPGARGWLAACCRGLLGGALSLAVLLAVLRALRLRLQSACPVPP